MTTIDRAAPVLVTGATGYVASWLVKRLVDDGITVHAAVRDASNAAKRRHLDEAAANGPGAIRYFEADLMTEGAYDAAMAGCQLVFHTASPFKVRVADPERDLLRPALEGTRNILGSADRCASVRRVVLTSSVAAIYGDVVDCAAAPGGVLTEDCWNTTSSLDRQPYPYSKTMAEREAWAIAAAQARWDLVAVNPSLIIGPALNPRGTSESFNLMRQFGNGAMKPGAPDIGIGVVDVRDVADAHMAAAFTPGTEGRHIVSGHNTSFPGIARILRPVFGRDFPIPARTLPKWVVWLFGPIADKRLTRDYVARNVGHAWRADNRKSIEALGIEYRPLDETLVTFFQQLVDTGAIKPKG